MSAGTFNDIIDQGSTYQTLLVFEVNKEPIDLTGYTARMYARTVDESFEVDLSDKVTFPDPEEGQILISIPADETVDYPAGQTLVYDLEIESAGGQVTRLIQGRLTVSQEVTV
jgi:hypothetical protein